MKGFKKSISVWLVLTLLLTTVSLLGAGSVSAADAVDLTVSSVAASTSTLNIESGSAVSTYLYATVRNSGDIATTGNISVSFFVDNRFFETVEYSTAVNSGGLAIIQSSTEKSLFFGSHSVRAVASYAGELAESDNKLKTRLTVYDAVYYPEPDPAPPKNESVISVPPTAQVTGATPLGTARYTTDKQNALSGVQAIGWVENAGDGGSFSYNAPTAGYYSVSARLSNGVASAKPRTTTDGYATVRVAANNVGGNVSVENSYNEFTSTGYWDSWSWTDSVRVYLNAGNNAITVTNVSGDCNIDCIKVTPGVEADYFTYFGFTSADNPQLAADIKCDINIDGTIVAHVPTTVDPSALIARYTTVSGVTSVKVLDVEQASGVTKNDFTNGHYYTVQKTGSTTITYSVTFDFLNDSTLPIAYVEFDRENDTTGLVNDTNINNLLNGNTVYLKENNAVPCYFTVALPENLAMIATDQNSNPSKYTEITDATGVCTIRGNSTLEYSKKAWKIKLDSKSKVLDMPKSKHWILLANSCDKTSLRQYMGYELGRVLSNQGVGYSPRTRFSHVYFDGTYKGLYLLMEQIKVDSNRLNIRSAEDDLIETLDTVTYPAGYYYDSTADYTGGYLIEYDDKLVGDPAQDYEDWEGYNGTYSQRFAIKDPGDLSAEHVNTANNLISGLNSALTSGNWTTVQEYIDVDSFVDWFIILEIMKAQDSASYSSIYMTKVSQTDARMQYLNQADYDADQALPIEQQTGVELEENPNYEGANGRGRFYMGPIWDFDISSGNSDWQSGHGAIISTSGWMLDGNLWWTALLDYSQFRDAVKARYADLRSSGDDFYCDILGMFDNAENKIDNAEMDNFSVWDVSLYAWPNAIISNSSETHDAHFRNWLSSRLSWLDANINNVGA